MTMPGYWMYETTGVLRPAVEAYLRDEPMTHEHIAAMRAYLRQWIDGFDGGGDGVALLRQAVDGLTSRDALERWLDFAIEEGVDPL